MGRCVSCQTVVLSDLMSHVLKLQEFKNIVIPHYILII